MLGQLFVLLKLIEICILISWKKVALYLPHEPPAKNDPIN
jgi:hypothetical protein